MRKSFMSAGVVVVGLAILALPSRTTADRRHRDFGSFVESQLADHSEQLFGFNRPLEQSALGPYDGPDNLQAIQVAPGLHVSLVSSSVASAADQIALWPDDDNPTYLFVCDEETSVPAVQRVDLSKPAEQQRHDHRHRPGFVRSGAPHTVGHHHRRGRSGSDRRPLRADRSGEHHHARST